MVCYWSGGNHEPCPNMATSRNCTWALGNNKYGLDQLHKPQSCGLEIPELERTSSPESPNDLLSTSYTICTFNYYTLRTGTVQNPFFFCFPTINQTPTSRHSEALDQKSVMRVQDRHLPTMQGVSNCGTAQGQTLVKKGKSSKWRVIFFMGIFMGARERERYIYIYNIFIYI